MVTTHHIYGLKGVTDTYARLITQVNGPTLIVTKGEKGDQDFTPFHLALVDGTPVTELRQTEMGPEAGDPVYRYEYTNPAGNPQVLYNLKYAARQAADDYGHGERYTPAQTARYERLTAELKAELAELHPKDPSRRDAQEALYELEMDYGFRMREYAPEPWDPAYDAQEAAMYGDGRYPSDSPHQHEGACNGDAGEVD